jgi:hypothetical protein
MLIPKKTRQEIYTALFKVRRTLFLFSLRLLVVGSLALVCSPLVVNSCLLDTCGVEVYGITWILAVGI